MGYFTSPEEIDKYIGKMFRVASSHPEVGNDHIEGFLLERFESVLAVRAGLAIETLSGYFA